LGCNLNPFLVNYRLDKTNIEEKVISNTPSINEKNCFLNIKQFASRLKINQNDEPTIGLFRIFSKVGF
jgi:peroxiredoxin